LAREALDLAKSFAEIGEVTAGSPQEKRLVNMIAGLVEELSDDVKLEEVPVTYWREDYCFVECEGYVMPCAVQPPTVGEVDIEFEVEKKSADVVIVDAPNHPDEFSDTYPKYVCRDGKLLLVYREPKPIRRRIVVLCDSIPKYGVAPMSPSIAVDAYIPQSCRKVRISAKASIGVGVGFNVIADSYGSGDLVYVTAHHDHWLSGFSDNLIGLALAYVFYKHLANKYGKRIHVRFISFTAEEGFSHPISPFYWLVGSRIHVLKNSEELLSRRAMNVNFDVIVSADKVRISTNDPLIKLEAMNAGANAEPDSDLFDSYSFSSIGIPSVTIHTFREAVVRGVYHSDIDAPDVVDLSTLAESLKIADAVVKSYLHTRSCRDFVEAFSRDFGDLELSSKPISLSTIFPVFRFLYSIWYLARERGHLSLHDLEPLIRTFRRLYNRFVVIQSVEGLSEISIPVVEYSKFRGQIEFPTGRQLELDYVDEVVRAFEYSLEMLLLIALYRFREDLKLQTLKSG